MDRSILFGVAKTLLRPMALSLILMTATSRLHAEDLTTTDGVVYKNITVTKVEPDGLRIIHSEGGGKVPFVKLPEAVQKKYHYDPAAAQKFAAEQEAKNQAIVAQRIQQATAAENAAPPVAAAPSTSAAPAKKPVKTLPDLVYPMVRGNLGFLDSAKLSSFDESKLSSVRYYAIYYSAHWCGPCRRFTPELVKFYNEFKPAHSDFELIFVSLDEDEARQTEYMKGESMPWPAVRHSALGLDSEGKHPRTGIWKYSGNGIPHLVLIDSATDSVMSSSYENGQYVGPQKVVADIRQMLK